MRGWADAHRVARERAARERVGRAPEGAAGLPAGARLGAYPIGRLTSLSNAQLAELLAQAAEQEAGHRERALRKAAASAFYWPEEASEVLEGDRSLTELPSVGPWLARLISSWLLDPPEPPEPPDVRKGFLTLAEVRSTLAEHPEWPSALRADLQMHTTYSDGAAPLVEMVVTAAAYGYEHVAITDHSKGLKIARGMDEEELADQGKEIDAVNEDLEDAGLHVRALRSLEMNLSPEGEGDMDPEALARLDLVLGAFHSALRRSEDQTERYLAALRNPTFNVLAHPRGRKFNNRVGLRADWTRVLEAAAQADKALEIDAYPDRQDLDVELLKLAREAGVRISIGTDAHNPDELRFMEFGLAAALLAEIPRERILNFMPREELLAWAGQRGAGG